MAVIWTTQDQGNEPDFENDDSAYAHYWLSTLPVPLSNRAAPIKKRSLLDQTGRLNGSVEDLIDRAFSG